jgi:putative spermidine/putrescine transport system ATP-binding protein
MEYFRGMVLLSVSGLSRKEKNIFTVKDISFEQAPLQKIAIAGETGSGKTTLLKMIAGLVQASAGEMIFLGKQLKGPNDQLIPGHAGIAYLSQHFELRNNYWVHEILSYANELTAEDAAGLYRVCRIEHLLQRRTDQLSGGEKQRIALARLLIGKPRLLLLDEPFSNLDAAHRGLIKNVLEDVNKRLGISCIMVSHDAPDILSWANTILVMQEGKLIQQGSAETIYRQPVNAYCAGLFGAYNLIDAANAAILLPAGTPVPPNGSLLVRPEALIMVQTDTGLYARVQSARFAGSYYLLEAVAAAQQLVIKTNNPTYKEGDGVRLSLVPGQPWYINAGEHKDAIDTTHTNSANTEHR